MKPQFLLLCLFSSLLFAGEHQSYIPHFTTKVGEWNTQLNLVNPNSVSASVELTAHRNDGAPLGSAQVHLPPYGATTQAVETLFGGLDAENGWISLNCNRANLDGLMVFTNLVTGGTSSVPLLKDADASLVLPLLDNSDDAISGLVVTNPSAEAVTLELSLVNHADGSTQTAQETLEAGARLIGITADVFGNDLPESASLRVLANGPVTGFALSFRNEMQQIVAVPAEVHDPGKLPVLTDGLRTLREQFGVASMSAGLDPADGDPLVANAGLANLEAAESMSPTHSADIGSITKTFVATLFLMYEEEGLITLQDTLSTWMPDFPKGDEITLRMMLEHTSGIFNYTSSDTYIEDLIDSYDTDLKMAPQRLVDYALAEGDGGFSFEPGSSWGYSNTNYILLGMIAEAVGNTTLESQLRSRILDPLNMDHTYLAGEENVPGRATQYLEDDDGELIPITGHLDMTWAWAAGAMASTPEDLMVFARALFTGQLISQASLDKMTTPEGPAIDAEYGLGLAVAEINGEPFWGHSGGTYGGTAFLAWLPERGASFANQITTSSDEDGFTELLVGTYITLTDQAQSKVAVDDASLKRLLLLR